MASAEREPITGVWGGAPSGQCLQWGGVREGKAPLKLNECFFVLACPKEAILLKKLVFISNFNVFILIFVVCFFILA